MVSIFRSLVAFCTSLPLCFYFVLSVSQSFLPHQNSLRSKVHKAVAPSGSQGDFLLIIFTYGRLFPRCQSVCLNNQRLTEWKPCLPPGLESLVPNCWALATTQHHWYTVSTRRPSRPKCHTYCCCFLSPSLWQALADVIPNSVTSVVAVPPRTFAISPQGSWGFLSNHTLVG